jgi:hypothetical protein
VVRALHVGRRDHYRLAADILDRDPTRVVLMQRSSTLLLGPELGWNDEATFYAAACASIERGAQWFHVASLAGIGRHLRRPGSRFPDRDRAAARLIDVDGVVAIGKASSAAMPVKDLPPERSAGDLKIDRQARLLLADFAGEFEAIIVFDVGDQQVSVHQCGPFARDLFEVCLDFWARCPSLTWSALNHECVNFLRP